MRAFVGSFLLVGLVTMGADGADRQEELFASWQEAQKGVESLVVQFSLEMRDRVFDEHVRSEGTFRLIRTSTGEVLAAYEVVQANAEKHERWSGLLNHGKVYLLDHEKKTAIRFEPPDGDVQQFLEKYFNPFVRLLDRKRAEEKCQLEVVKQDESYTYLAVKRKGVIESGWFPDTFREGQVILMNKSSENVPKDMPRQLAYRAGHLTYTFAIHSWQINGPEAPKVEEFTRPENRPGWIVSDWPFGPKK